MFDLTRPSLGLVAAEAACMSGNVDMVHILALASAVGNRAVVAAAASAAVDPSVVVLVAD